MVNYVIVIVQKHFGLKKGISAKFIEVDFVISGPIPETHHLAIVGNQLIPDIVHLYEGIIYCGF